MVPPHQHDPSPGSGGGGGEDERQSVVHLQAELDHRFSFRSETNAGEDTSEGEGGLVPANRYAWLEQPLVVVVLGASGDLAKKKTYPSLLELYDHGLLPPQTQIWGYARTPKTHEQLRDHLKGHLTGSGVASGSAKIDAFLNMCFYHHGKAYGDQQALTDMLRIIARDFPTTTTIATKPPNTLYYLAIPPNVFAEVVNALQSISGAVQEGSTKFVIEKPFGRDTQSCKDLLDNFGKLPEVMQYRLDHYLAKPMVEGLSTLRQANPWLENLWNHEHIQSIHIRFKEPFGTQGRGGYFDQFNIIRDVLQNHLLQVLLLVAMELPSEEEEEDASASKSADSFRQAKIAVLEQMPPIVLEDALLGQYDGYKDDPTITNKETICPTYAALRCFVNSARWKGVPFILEAGKALDQKVVDIQVVLKQKATGGRGRRFPSNILTIQVQPEQTLTMTAHMKSLDPASAASASGTALTTTTLSTNYTAPEGSIENAYSRLLLDVLKGNAQNFVRADELVKSWEVFTPLLDKIENETIQPEPYAYGSDGPKTRSSFLKEMMMRMGGLKQQKANL